MAILLEIPVVHQVVATGRREDRVDTLVLRSDRPSRHGKQERERHAGEGTTTQLDGLSQKLSIFRKLKTFKKKSAPLQASRHIWFVAS